MQRSKSVAPTCASTADSGSSSRYTSAALQEGVECGRCEGVDGGEGKVRSWPLQRPLCHPHPAPHAHTSLSAQPHKCTCRRPSCVPTPQYKAFNLRHAPLPFPPKKTFTPEPCPSPSSHPPKTFT
eukprot:79520-Chlamydomonas_euryale.AAC.1